MAIFFSAFDARGGIEFPSESHKTALNQEIFSRKHPKIALFPWSFDAMAIINFLPSPWRFWKTRAYLGQHTKCMAHTFFYGASTKMYVRTFTIEKYRTGVAHDGEKGSDATLHLHTFSTEPQRCTLQRCALRTFCTEGATLHHRARMPTAEPRFLAFSSTFLVATSVRTMHKH